jgi:hypothetical protein
MEEQMIIKVGGLSGSRNESEQMAENGSALNHLNDLKRFRAV